MEQWKDITGWENVYKISDHGNIMSFVNNRWGLTKNGKIIKPQCSKHSVHYHIVLSYNNKKEQHNLHKLVALYFVPNPENKKYVDHIDGNGLNNHYTNLRWCTGTESNQNTKMKDNYSGMKGVYYNNDGRKKPWEAQLSCEGNTYRKTFETQEEAINYRDYLVETYFDKNFYIKDR